MRSPRFSGCTSVRCATGGVTSCMAAWRVCGEAGGREQQQAKIGPHAGAIAAAILNDDVRHDGGWTLGRLCAEIARRGGPAISPRWLSHQLRQRGFASRRPRHTLKGRQDTAAVAASRERLADLKTRAAAGAIDLVSSTYSKRSRIPIWRAAGRGAAPGCASKHPARQKSGRCSGPSIHYAGACSCTPAPPSAPPISLPDLDELGAAYGTTERARPLIAVLDNGPIHTSKLTTKALAARTWLTLEWLPKYDPT